MVSVVICVGSSCHVRGSDKVAESLEALIRREGLENQVALSGAFCMDRCSMGVSVRVGTKLFQEIYPQDVERFFYGEIMPKVKAAQSHYGPLPADDVPIQEEREQPE